MTTTNISQFIKAPEVCGNTVSSIPVTIKYHARVFCTPKTGLWIEMAQLTLGKNPNTFRAAEYADQQV